VPESNLLGEEANGFHQTMQTLDGGRISIARCMGLAQAALEAMVIYAKQRYASASRYPASRPSSG